MSFIRALLDMVKTVKRCEDMIALYKKDIKKFRRRKNPPHMSIAISQMMVVALEGRKNELETKDKSFWLDTGD